MYSTFNAAGREQDRMEDGMIGLLCATPDEMACILALISQAGDVPSPGGTRLIGGYAGGREVMLLCAGVGKVPAAAGTRFLVDNFSLEALLVCGIAGALSPDARLGELIIATELVPGDVGIAHSGGFRPTGPGLVEDGRLVFHPSLPVSRHLLAEAEDAAVRAGLSYLAGRVITCDQVVLDPELRTHLGELFDAVAVEMEGAAAAHVAAGEGIPFLAVRAISDELTHDFVGLENLLAYKGQRRRNIWHKRFALAVGDAGALARLRELSRGRDEALYSLSSFLRSFLADP